MDEEKKEKLTYKEKFVQMNKEAKATWILAAIVIAFWWIGGFGLYYIAGTDLRIAHMPAWVIVSCFGAWIISIIGVVFLVKRVFKDFDLGEDIDAGKAESETISISGGAGTDNTQRQVR